MHKDAIFMTIILILSKIFALIIRTEISVSGRHDISNTLKKFHEDNFYYKFQF